HRETMDAGCRVAWDHCYSETDELSAIQHAYNMLIDYGYEAFQSECQCEPIRDEGAVLMPSSEFLKAKQSGYPRGTVPTDCTKLTAFIDQQDNLLYWMVVAWSEGFTGYIVDYGSFPDQKRSYFTLETARRTLLWFFNKQLQQPMDQEGALHNGISRLVSTLATRTFPRAGGGGQTIDQLAIDTNNGKRTVLIKSVIEQSPHRASILASYGRGVKARHKQISQWQNKPGREKGPEWVIDRPEGQSIRQLIYDTWFWKKRAADALALALGSKGSLAFFKEDPERHRMVVDHIRSNKAFETKDEGSGQSVIEWELRPGEEDHLWDCLIGCMVLASICGIRRAEDKRPTRNKRRKKVKYL
ncbi:MAG: terminase gpA endonuclease subunit, partial [Planctomycetota bacterium]